MLQRAVFMVDGNERTLHAEYVADRVTEPDYDAPLEAVRQSPQI